MKIKNQKVNFKKYSEKSIIKSNYCEDLKPSDQPIVILGIVGRICSGKETFTQGNKLKYHSLQVKQLQGFEIQQIFHKVYQLQEDKLKVEQYLKQVIKIQNYKENSKKNEIIGKQAFYDWADQSSADGQLKPKAQIIYPVTQMSLYNYMQKRNYFHLVQIHCSAQKRYINFLNKYKKFQNKISFELFCFVDDYLFFKSDLQRVSQLAKFHYNNDGKSKKEFLNDWFVDQKYLKMHYTFHYDQYFMEIAYIVKHKSNCMKRAVGAVLTKDNVIQSVGFNGTPELMLECYKGGCNRCNSNASQGTDLSKCVCIHAEANSIFQVGITNAKDCTLYTTLYPCTFCAKIIGQAQIKTLVYALDYDGNKSSFMLEKIKTIKVNPMISYMA